MITIEEYLMGRAELYPDEWKPEYRDNAAGLLEAVNGLLAELGDPKVRVSSGYRPPSVNRKIKGAALHSNHTTAHAVDIADPDRRFARLLIRNLPILERRGLYLENPGRTKGWVHLQNIAPKSGRRVFDP